MDTALSRLYWLRLTELALTESFNRLRLAIAKEEKAILSTPQPTLHDGRYVGRIVDGHVRVTRMSVSP